MEEPVTPDTDDGLRRLAPDSSVPIATGERLTSRREVRQLLADGVVDVLQQDMSLTGLFELEEIARLGRAYDVAIAPHCPNGPVSLAASLQVGSCCGNVVIQEQSAGIHYHAGFAGLPAAELFDYLRDPAPLRTDRLARRPDRPWPRHRPRRRRDPRRRHRLALPRSGLAASRRTVRSGEQAADCKTRA